MLRFYYYFSDDKLSLVFKKENVPKTWRSHPCLWCKRNIGKKFKPQNLSPGGLIWAVVSMFHVSKTPSIISTNSKSICYTFRHQSAIKFVCLYFLFILFFATVFCEAKTSHPPARRDSGQIISS